MIHLQSLFNLPSLTTETSNDLRTLRDQTNKAIQVLSNLGCATEHWDDWLFLVTPKLDKSSQKTWELKLGDTIDYPCYRELDQFLAFVRSHRAEKATSKRKTLVLHTAPMFCFCAHYAKRTYCINVLSMFLKQTPSQRFECIKTQKRCMNYFSTKHAVKVCTNSRACRV